MAVDSFATDSVLLGKVFIFSPLLFFCLQNRFNNVYLKGYF